MPAQASLSKEEMNEIVDRWESRRDFVIEMLQDVQQKLHWLPIESLRHISERVQVPLGQIYHLATFYKGFSLEPRGEHIVHVCMGTACHVKGAVRVLEACERDLSIKSGQTTEDGMFTLEEVQCLGCCGLAAVMTVDEDLHGHVNAVSAPRILTRCRKKDAKKNEQPAEVQS